MPDPQIRVLNTVTAEAGPTQTVKQNFLKKDKPLRISADLGAGDTVVIEGKSVVAEDFETLATFTTNTPQDVYVSRVWRARRTVDGTSGDSEIFVENSFKLNLTAHA